MINTDPLDKVFLTPQARLEIAISKLPTDLKEVLRESIERRIAAAVAAERERCANVADEKARTANPKYSQADYASSIAAAIRALK